MLSLGFSEKDEHHRFFPKHSRRPRGSCLLFITVESNPSMSESTPGLPRIGQAGLDASQWRGAASPPTTWVVLLQRSIGSDLPCWTNASCRTSRHRPTDGRQEHHGAPGTPTRRLLSSEMDNRIRTNRAKAGAMPRRQGAKEPSHLTTPRTAALWANPLVL